MEKTTDHVRIAQISLALFLIAVYYKLGLEELCFSVGPRVVSHEVLHSSSSSSALDISQQTRRYRSRGLHQTSRLPSIIQEYRLLYQGRTVWPLNQLLWDYNPEFSCVPHFGILRKQIQRGKVLTFVQHLADGGK